MEHLSDDVSHVQGSGDKRVAPTIAEVNVPAYGSVSPQLLLLVYLYT
jgi:hypothetical protein